MKRPLYSLLAVLILPSAMLTAKPEAPDAAAEIKNVRAIQSLQVYILRQEEQVQKCAQMQQAYMNIVKDLAGAAFEKDGTVKNKNIQALLGRNGWNVTGPNIEPAATPAPPPAPQPIAMDPEPQVSPDALPEDMKKDYETLETRIRANKLIIERGGAVQAQLQTLVQQLLDLGKTDADAAVLVKKYSIVQQTPPAH